MDTYDCSRCHQAFPDRWGLADHLRDHYEGEGS